MEKISNTAKRLEELMHFYNVNQNDICKRTGIPKSAMSMYVSGQRSPRQNRLSDLAEAYGVSETWLMGYDVPMKSDSENHLNISNIYPIEVHKLPMLGEIACGEPKYTNEDRESYVDAGTNIEADFCLKAKGDSMINARIHDGDIVFIRRQDIVENGEIAAVVVNNDSEATLKRFYYYQERATLILKPENPAYEDLIFQNEELNEVHVLGKAIAFQSDVK